MGAPEKPTIGIKDIARYAGVSTGPVDKILNNRGGVSKATEAKILKAIEELGYQPNIFASRLKSAKEYRIAVLMPYATNDIPYWGQHQHGFDAAMVELRPYGIKLEMLPFSQNDVLSFKDAVSKAILGNFQGILMVPVFHDDTARLLNATARNHVPVVFFDSNISGLGQLSFIGQHSGDSGYTAAEIMGRCVPERSEILIATIKKKDDNHLHFANREAGFRTYFENKNNRLVTYENEVADEQTIAAELLDIVRSTPSLSGIFVTNDIHKLVRLLPTSLLDKRCLIGYDLIDENIDYLKKEHISFLISQQPQMQAYKGVKVLYEYLVLKKKPSAEIFVPIDIITPTNIKYYNRIELRDAVLF
ncbi:LacI family DNA-binding transcriptional regulator [Parapedobacter sp.]